jgi:hypothetical protein
VAQVNILDRQRVFDGYSSEDVNESTRRVMRNLQRLVAAQEA